jgi:Mg-chelatase subunit ChlD
LTIRERCDPERRKADAVLVLDTSRSMTGAKLAGAQRAARAFVSQLSLGRDRAAVVAFDDAARVVLPLSADRLALEAAIDSLTTAPGTRIDLGLEAALTVLAAGGTDPLRTRVIVVLTDGRQVVEPERAEAQAASARAAGVLIYTIGLGTDVDGPFLVGLAGDQQRYFFAPGEAELVGIYQQIAVDIPCPQSSFWPRRR